MEMSLLSVYALNSEWHVEYLTPAAWWKLAAHPLLPNHSPPKCSSCTPVTGEMKRRLALRSWQIGLISKDGRVNTVKVMHRNVYCKWCCGDKVESNFESIVGRRRLCKLKTQQCLSHSSVPVQVNKSVITLLFVFGVIYPSGGFSHLHSWCCTTRTMGCSLITLSFLSVLKLWGCFPQIKQTLSIKATETFICRASPSAAVQHPSVMTTHFANYANRFASYCVFDDSQTS